MHINCLLKMNGVTIVIGTITNRIFTNIWYNTQI